MPGARAAHLVATAAVLLLGLATAPATVTAAAAAAAASAGGAPLTVAQKEQATSRLLQQLNDLGLWSGVVACSDSAADQPYTASFGSTPY